MPLSEKAAANILRLLNTGEDRNSALAFRLLSSQGAVDDFLLSLCGHFMVARGAGRLALRKCLRSLLRIAGKERGCTSAQQNNLMWLLNYDPDQEKADPERFLSTVEATFILDVLPLARYIYAQSGRCARFLLHRSHREGRTALLESRIFNGPYGRALDLSRLQLFHLPDEARQFTNLEGLDLSHNNLNISDVFFLRGFRPLRFLNLSHNKLEHIPDGVPLLSCLEEVDLRGNPIELSLFEYLRHPLKDKLKVNLSLEKGFTLSQFNPLDIACLLKNWATPTGRGQLLNLAGKEIRSVPDAVLQYSELKYIDLRENPISFLPSWLLRMPQLCEIYCDKGVEYNPAFLRDGLTVFREKEKDPPKPDRGPQPWLPNLKGFAGSLPISLSVDKLIEE